MRQILIAVMVLAASRVGIATLVVPADLGELARDARAIARGRVVAIDATWTDDRRTIETIVTLETESYLKGQLGETVRFRVPGGQLGRYRRVVVGAPHFVVGQRVIVFLGATGPMIPYILGLSQGVFPLARDAAGDWTVTHPPLPPTAAGPIVRGTVMRQPVPLSQFERDVRALAERIP